MKKSTKKLIQKLWVEAVAESTKPLPTKMPNRCYIRPPNSDKYTNIDFLEVINEKFHAANYGILESLKGWEWSSDLTCWNNCN